MKVLAIICARNPNQMLLDNIKSLYKLFNGVKICVVDSDSTSVGTYESVKKEYPEVDLHFIKNKNYEYGAYKYGYETHNNYDLYICVQDSFIINKEISLNVVDEKRVFTCIHASGFHSHPGIRGRGIELLRGCDLDYSRIIDSKFNLAQHNFFIVTNGVLRDMFKTLINPPTDKVGSCCYERLFGLYFILKGIETIDITGSYGKANLGRH